MLPADWSDPLESGTCESRRKVQIGESLYEVRCNELGLNSRGTGTVITLLQGAIA